MSYSEAQLYSLQHITTVPPSVPHPTPVVTPLPAVPAPSLVDQLAPGVTAGQVTDWVTTIQGGAWAYLSNYTRLNVRPDVQNFGITVGVRTIGTSGGSIGYTAVVYNDNTDYAVNGWGHYTTIARVQGAQGATFGSEIDVANLGTDGDVLNPFAMGGGGVSVGKWICAGGELAVKNKCYSASAAFAVRVNDPSHSYPNNANFTNLLVVGADVIAGTDGNTGMGEVIKLATCHAYVWYNSQNERVGSIMCDANGDLRLDATGKIYLNGVAA